MEIYGFGKLIVFEGIDGCGKTTHANLLLESLGPEVSDEAVIKGERWILLDGLLDRTSLSSLILKEVKEVLSVPIAVSL